MDCVEGCDQVKTVCVSGGRGLEGRRQQGGRGRGCGVWGAKAGARVWRGRFS
jgi:hypothetical protein